MSYAKRMLQLPTSRIQYVFALAIVSALAFSLALATGPMSRRIALMTVAVDQPQQTALVAPGTENLAAAVQARPALARVPYEANWDLYDNGWAGGPALKTGISKGSALIRVPYEAGWELYDGGWAGGPSVD